LTAPLPEGEGQVGGSDINIKYFKAFFGIRPSAIRETVIISPIIYPAQFEKVAGKKGKHYKSILGYLVANFKGLTFIKTPMTQGAVSDLVFLLKMTKCSKVIFLGAIGGLEKGLKIGDIFVTKKGTDIYSVKSIHEETKEKLFSLKRRGIFGIDFETRAFFGAAKSKGIPAKGYYIVTDLPLTKPFYLKKTKNDIKKIYVAVMKASTLASAEADEQKD
jgi:uridine phosphorylase